MIINLEKARQLRYDADAEIEEINRRIDEKNRIGYALSCQDENLAEAVRRIYKLRAVQ